MFSIIEKEMKTKSQTTTQSGHKGSTSISMKCYFEDIKGFDLLSKEEEVALGRRIQEDGDAGSSRAAGQREPQAGGKDCQRLLPGSVVDVEDLVSEGNIGLMKAAEQFDPEFGVRFSTYAAWWIRQMIKRALGNQSRTIRLPLHVLQKLRELDRAERELGEELGRDPTLDRAGESGVIAAQEVGGAPPGVAAGELVGRVAARTRDRSPISRRRHP